jgi:hypothetical protein
LPDVDIIGKKPRHSKEQVMALTGRCSVALLLSGLSGCVVAPLPQRPLPLVAVPGPAKTAAEFQQDDVACRAAAAPAPGPGSAAPAQTSPSATPSPAQPGQSQDDAAGAAGTYLHCMESHNNVVQPLLPARPLVYAAYAPYGYFPGLYGPYDGYGVYPWLYDGSYGAYFGGGFYGWRGGYGGGDRGGFRGGYGGGYGGGRR